MKGCNDGKRTMTCWERRIVEKKDRRLCKIFLKTLRKRRINVTKKKTGVDNSSA